MVPVMGPQSAAYLDVARRAANAGASPWFMNALVALWDAGRAWGVDPVVLAAQCAHETSWGQFGGAVTPEMGNTCGLKKATAAGDRPEDHASFPMMFGFPMLGAVAHAHHLRLYAGFPVPADSPDPRARFVGPGTAGFGKAVTVEQLSRRWAPSGSYGSLVVKHYATLTARTVVNINKTG